MPTATKKKPAVPPTHSRPPTGRAELEARRGGVTVPGPSGEHYRVRKLDPRRFALAGHLPTELLDLVLDGNPRSVRQKLAENDKAALVAYQEYVDRVVAATIVSLENGDEITIDDLQGEDPLIPVVDQEWAYALALGQTEQDGLGRRVWGPEVKASFDVYQEAHAHAHACPPGCSQCKRAVDEVVRHFSQPGAV